MQTNYCKSGLMSECTAKDYTKCKYARESSQSDKCMYRSIKFDFDKDCYHCDNLKAQQEAREQYHKELIEEAKEGAIPT